MPEDLKQQRMKKTLALLSHSQREEVAKLREGIKAKTVIMA